jgi:peptidoglycan biosynthesis protein MviN/MurJ (putative lipid II flippase)
LAVALSLLRPLGMLGLVLADSAKHVSHALTMLVLTRRRIGSLADMRLGQTVVKASLAAAAMAGVIYLASVVIQPWTDTQALADRLIALVVPGGLGTVAFLGMAAVLRIEEMGLLRSLVRERLPRRRLD